MLISLKSFSIGKLSTPLPPSTNFHFVILRIFDCSINLLMGTAEQNLNEASVGGINEHSECPQRRMPSRHKSL
jgi:hypothetical protein